MILLLVRGIMMLRGAKWSYGRYCIEVTVGIPSGGQGYQDVKCSAVHSGAMEGIALRYQQP